MPKTDFLFLIISASCKVFRRSEEEGKKGGGGTRTGEAITKRNKA